jgi:hypothetical protein
LPAQRKDTLRDLLRARLASVSANREAAKPDDKPVANPDGTASADDDPAAPPPPLTDANEIYCSAMARAVIRGELTIGGGTPILPECKATIAVEALKANQQKEGPQPFTMSDVETDSEIKRLMGEQPAQNNLN